MTHIRVIPRDFFNEAKLLKCMGQLQLCIHDRKANGLPLETTFDGKPFEIFQDPADGSLTVFNYRVFLEGSPIALYTPYNARGTYPLIGVFKGEEYIIFDEDGKFIPTFGYKNTSEPRAMK